MNLVTHKTTNIVRALKTIKKDAIPKEDEKKLLSEMNILKTLDHPGVIKLIELYQDDKHYYLITEYLFTKFLKDLRHEGIAAEGSYLKG